MKLSELKKLASTFSGDMKNQTQRESHMLALGFEPGSIYQELEMESKFVDAHMDISFANAHVNLHSHNFYELLYCRNNCGAEYLVGTERYQLQKGDVIFVPPGVSHRPLLPEVMPEPYKRDVIWMSQEFLNSYASLFEEKELSRENYIGIFRTAGTQWESIGEIFHNCVWESEERNLDWETAVIGNTILLLTQIHRAIHNRAARPLKAEKPELLDRVLAYVEEHLAEKITLADVARQFFVSESTISQTFRKKMGVSFYHCVNQRRLITAKTLIGQGIPLEMVGSYVGFADYSTFYRAFKKEYSISPRQFRKIQINAE